MRYSEQIRGFKSERMSRELTEELREACRKGRLWSLMMTSAAKSGHPGGSLSSMEIYMTLLCAAQMTPQTLACPDRDRVVVSHGHTSPGFYSALAAHGFFSAEELLPNFRRAGSMFQGHVEREVPGVDWGTGNLGQGLAAGVGFALAARALGSRSRVWVALGDGEQVKGQIAEARRVAAKTGLTNLTALIDWNDIQISGRLEDVMPCDIEALWRADGWAVFKCDGHDVSAVYAAMREAGLCGKPAVILCRTVIGKGVSFLEGDPECHGKAVSDDMLPLALGELGGSIEEYHEVLRARAGKIPVGQCPAPVKPNLTIGVPHTYTKDDKKDNRGAFGKALAEVGALNYKKEGATPILVFDCDLAGSVKVDAFAEACPDWFYENGIQEHATATIAGAAAAGGVAAVWADFGVFGCDEVYNQQRLNDINSSGIKTVLTHVGLDVGEDGATHQCIDYVGLFHNAFGWKVVVPADPNQTDRATRWMLEEPGCVCLAMGRSVLPPALREDGAPFFAGNYEFIYGAIDKIRKGKDVAILAMGHLVSGALEARELLAARGVNAMVLHCASPLGFDGGELFETIGDMPLVTCEDHNVNTGLGSVVALKAARAGKAVRLRTLGVSRYGESGTSKDVISAMGLSPKDIAEAAEGLLDR